MTKTNAGTGEKNSSFRWLTLKTLRGLIEFKILLKVEYEGELRISESNLFHSANADGKKELKEKVIPYFKLENHQFFTNSCLV